jgi:outer membrane protein assembly factor BamB
MTNALLLLALSLCLDPHAPPAPVLASPAQTATPLQKAWQTPLGAARGAQITEVLSVGERALALDASGGVTSLDPTTGELQWFVQLPGAVRYLPSDGGAIALTSGATVVVVDGPSGRRLYQTTSAMAPGASPCSDGRLLFVPALLDDTLVAWDMARDSKAWEFHMPAPHAGPALLGGPEGARSVLLPGADGTLRAIPAQSEVPRKERWAAQLGRLVGVPLVLGETVVVGSANRVVVALDAGSGAVRWRVSTGDAPRTSPMLVGDVVVLGTQSQLLALNKDTGALVWEREATDRPLGAVGGELLVRCGPGAGSQWVQAGTGQVLMEKLPGNAIAVSDWLVEMRDGSTIAGWKRAR